MTATFTYGPDVPEHMHLVLHGLNPAEVTIHSKTITPNGETVYVVDPPIMSVSDANGDVFVNCCASNSGWGIYDYGNETP